MKRDHFVLAVAIVVAVATALVSSCGGGSSGSSSGASMGAPTTASGVLTAFGSIFVNGTEYATSGSTTVVDGDNDDAPSSLAALQAGMTVDVNSSGGWSPWASLIRHRSLVRGTVEEVPGNGTLQAMGQTVVITSATSFAGSNASGPVTNGNGGSGSVQVGDYATVYGFLECTSSTTPCSATQVVATLVYVSTTPTIYKVEGYAQVSGGAIDSFTINALTVDYTTSGGSATNCTPSPCSITNGELVEARSTTAPSGLTLAATRIKAISELPVLTIGSTVSIEGLVSQLTSTMSGVTFNLRGVSVTAISGVAPTDLQDNQIVEVTGTVAANGTITASAITIVRSAAFTIVAPMTLANGPPADTVTLLGQTFTVNTSTRFADWAQFMALNLSNFASVLQPGDQLVVSGYSTATGDVATRVERIPPPTTPFDAVQGVVTADSPSSTQGTLTIGGVAVTMNGSTTLRYPGANGSPTLTGFFDAVTVGTTVAAAIGTAGTTTGTMTATGALALPSTCQWMFGPQ